MARSDKQIKQDILDQLAFNNRLDESAIDVEVSNGHVVLSGIVPSYPDLAAAEKDAAIILGVQSVENRLRVEPPTEEVTVPTDGEILADVERMLVKAPDVAVADLSLSVESGEVVLKGTVDQLWKKFRAQALAGNIAGVRGIENHLVVVPTESMLDRVIGEGIESALERLGSVDAAAIDVEVRDGVVTLKGKASGSSARREAEEVAKHAKGVIEVYNELRVE